MTPGEQSLQQAREREALVRIREHLDEQERDRPLGSVREAVTYTAKTLPLVVGGLLLVAILAVAALKAYRSAIAPKSPPNRAEYAAAAFSKAEELANKHGKRVFDGLRGSVEVSFRVRPDGHIDLADVVGPPRDSVMEGAALSLLKAAQPFGSFPEGAHAEPMVLRGTWRFGGPGARAILFTPAVP